jgi:hypothetical protein
MRRLLLTATAVAVCTWVGAAATAQAADEPPPWAYGFTTPPPPNAPRATPNPAQPQDNVVEHSIEGSQRKFTRAKIANRFGPADWFPGDHPTMPLVVERGAKRANIYACNLCHYRTAGRPENADVTGLTTYFPDLKGFKNGARKTSDPRKGNTGLMGILRSDDGRGDRGRRPASPRSPPSRGSRSSGRQRAEDQAAGGMYLVVEGAEGQGADRQPHHQTPTARTTPSSRNPRSSFTAYVPPGSLQKGEPWSKAPSSGRRSRLHDLPRLRPARPRPAAAAGRSPSYLTRQLYDMQHGNRNGAWTVLMAPVIAGMNADDVLNASAYLASLQP